MARRCAHPRVLQQAQGFEAQGWGINRLIDTDSGLSGFCGVAATSWNTRRCRHLGGSGASSGYSAAICYRYRQSPCPSSAKTRSYGSSVKGTGGMESFLQCCQSSPTRPATISLSCRGEQAQAKLHGEPSTFPRSGKPVTIQVTTTPGNTRRSATRSDTDIRLACGNTT